VAGPLWLGEILSGRFLSKMLKAARSENDIDRRLTRLLNMASAEVDAPPTYYVVDRISDKLGSSAPPKSDVIQRLLNLGYRAVPTHFNSRGVKTDAPAKIVKEAVLGAAETKQTTKKAPRCFK
jgi:tRNA G26 N,N-dimethylase Trm1